MELEVDRLTAIINDCELEQILEDIENDCRLGVEAVDFLKKMAYFDSSHGVHEDLCYLVISKWTSNFIPNSTEEEAKEVLRILQNYKLIYDKQKENPNCFKSLQLLPCLKQKLLNQNGQNSSVLIELAMKFQKILYAYFTNLPMSQLVPHVVHIHKFLKQFNWPDDTIKCSVYFAVHLMVNEYDLEMGLEIVKDIAEFLKTVNCSESVNVNEANWFAIQMIRIYNKTIMKSRKLLQPSDIIGVELIDGTTQDIRLDNYGSWILNKIRCCADSKLDCDAITLVGVATLERLQKHARFCNKPDELTLNWVVSCNENDWHSLNCFAALACFTSTDGWLEKMCRAYIRKLFDQMELCGNSDYSLRNVYLSWVCLRDMVKTSRIRDQMISALTDDEGFKFLFMNCRKCESSLESKEYFLKYQGQTVIEMLTPLLIHGKSEDVQKLLKSQEFWNFVILILTKHPFINERYDLTYENDLLCACEVYLDLLIAICDRNQDISEGVLDSFLRQDFLNTFTIAIKAAGELLEPRQRHTCKFYLFTILFTFLDKLNAIELADIYFNCEAIRTEVEELIQENFIFEVPDGCLRDYRKHLKNFMDIYKIRTDTSNSVDLTSTVKLVENMTIVPEKYDWESNEIEKLQ